MERWHDQVVQARRATKAALLWKNHVVGRAWRQWEAMLLELKCGRVMAMKAVKMWIGIIVGRSWRTWMMKIVERKRLQALTSRIVLRWKHGALSKGLGKWYCEVVQARRATKAALLWKNHAVGRAWRQWEAMVFDSKCRRVMAMKAVKMWKGMSIGRSWRAWRMMVVERKRLKALFSRVVLRWKHGTLSKGMESWCAGVVKTRKATRAAQIWKHHVVGRGWRGWEVCVADVKRLRHTGTIVVQHWRNKLIAAAWERWYEYTIEVTISMQLEQESNGDIKERDRLVRMLARQALQKWVGGCHKRSWNKWRAEVWCTKVIGRALLKWLHKLSSRAFESWYQSYQENKCLRIMAYTAIKMWVGMIIGRAWRRWDVMVVDVRRLRALSAKCISRWQ